MRNATQTPARISTMVFVVLLVSGLTPAASQGQWVTTGRLAEPRWDHSATLLPNGKVLIAGGVSGSSEYLRTAELYDPAKGVWTSTGSLARIQSYHTATMLPNGKVLAVSGWADLYDPANGTWTAINSPARFRNEHTATLLPNGKVLIVGGYNGNVGELASAELYDPATGTWTATGSMSSVRTRHTATLLPNGTVLVVGGYRGREILASAEIYDPATGQWTTTGLLAEPRYSHTATLLPDGKVLVAAGAINEGQERTSAELFDPATGNWLLTGSLAMSRQAHSATLLPNGKVLVVGGQVSQSAVDTAELYDPFDGRWTATPLPRFGRHSHTATLLPNGSVLLAGGVSNQSGLRSLAEIYLPDAAGAWHQTGTPAIDHDACTATLLSSGEVLVVGGSSAELYDPLRGIWRSAGPPTDNVRFLGRVQHSATLLANGNVLVVGGNDATSVGFTPLVSAVLYDTASDRWKTTGSLSVPRVDHTATLLPSGKVLVAGGVTEGGVSSLPAEVYDPSTGQWSLTGTIFTFAHTATLLLDGNVLVVDDRSAKLYDERSSVWTTTGSPTFSHRDHTATLLPSGKVLVTGGDLLASAAELYDPATRTWTPTGTPATTRADGSATLMLDGNVLVTGGRAGDGTNSRVLSTAEIYHPSTETWTSAASLATPRSGHVAALLPTGSLLVLGGSGDFGSVLSAELYTRSDPLSVRPVLTALSATIAHGTPLVITGTSLGGVPEGSGGGYRSSPANYPLIRLHSIANDHVSWLVPDARGTFADNPMTLTFSTLPPEVDPGWNLITPIRNGVIGESKLIRIECNVAIIESPRSATPVKGERVTFTVNVAGGRHYQWEKNVGAAWFAIGDDQSSYITEPVTPADSGARYRVRVSGACASAVSSEASLTIFDTNAPAANVVSPVGGEYWLLSTDTAASTRIVTWSMSDDVRVCQVSVSLLYSNDGGVTYVQAPAGGGLSATYGPGGSCLSPGEGTTSLTYTVPASFPSGRVGSLYRIQVIVTDHAGNAKTATSTNPFYIVQANPDSVRTLILWNSSRMRSRTGDVVALGGKLQELANHPRVQGLVIDLASVTAIGGLYATWDAEPANGSKANAVLFGAGGIHEYLRTNVLAAYSGVKYVVIVGDDRIVPMARMRDRTVLLLESTYPARGDLTASGSTVGQALAADRYLTDDPLGVLDATTVENLEGNLFLPDLAIGRLVETPQQIITTIATYISQDGILDLSLLDPTNGHKVLITGYDFLSNVAAQQRTHWKRALNALTTDTATAPVDGSLIGAGWGLGSVQERASALRRKLSGNGATRYAVMALAGHATHYEEGVPGTDPFDIQGLSTIDIYGTDACGTTSAGAIDLAGAVVYAIGCHGGLSVPGSCRTDADHSLDVPETMLSRGVVAYVANSGYGWSLRFGIGYSARLSQIFTEQITSGGTIAVGEAVRQSKQRYYLETPRYDAYDEKSVMQWTLYGLPMYAIKTGIVAGEKMSIPVRRQLRTSTNALPSSLTQLNLSFNFTADGVYEKHDSAGRLLPVGRGCPDASGCYYTLNGVVDRGTGSADLPIQPYVIYDSRLSGTSQHGVLWKGGTYDEESGWTPVIAQLISNGGDGSNHGPSPRKIIHRPTAARVLPGVDSPVCRPTDLEVSSVTITGGEAVKEQLSDSVYSILRRYRTVDVEVFYFNNRTSPADNCDRSGPSLDAAPFNSEYHQLTGSMLSWAVPANDNAGVWRVIVVYNTNTVDAQQQGTWTPLELTNDGTGTFRGHLRFEIGTRLTYVIQAVDNRGNVTWLDYVSAQLPASGTALGIPKPVDVTKPAGSSVGRRRSAGQ